MRRRFLKLALTGLLAFSTTTAYTQDLTRDLKDLSKKQVEDTVEFAFGNALFFLFHEAGHMLVSEFGLPVLGREEDAVDTLSTLLLLEADDDVFDTALIDSVDGWTFSAEEAEAGEKEPTLWDAHGLDRQRAFNMVCLMVGKDAKKFKATADELELPESRRKECVGEYRKARESWFGVLKPHLKTDDKETKFAIRYAVPKSKNLKDYADITKEAQILDILAQLLSSLYKLNDGIKLTAAECGEPNAYWSSGDREITYCYELMRWHTQAIANYFREQAESSEDEDTAEDDSASQPKNQPRQVLKSAGQSGASR